MQKYQKQGKYTYNQNDLLGEGSFGKVYKGYNCYTGQWVALKQIQLQKIQKEQQMLKTILLSQISVMKRFNKKMQLDPCPFLVRQQDVFRTDKHIFIVMELCEGGTLEDEIRGKRFNEKQCIQVLYCMARGVQYMNAMGITHRDLKPQNIFISTIKLGQGTGKAMKIYKIGDFGFASQKQQFDIAMGTLPYMAPEMFRKKQKYGHQVDVWSLGTIAYEIIFGGLYFIGKDRFQIQKNIRQKPFVLSQRQKTQASANYQDFLFRCLTKQPKYRITANQMLNHPLFYGIQQQLAHIQSTVFQEHEDKQVKSSPINLSKSESEQSKSQLKIFEQSSKPQNQSSSYSIPAVASNKPSMQPKIEQSPPQQQIQQQIQPSKLVFIKVSTLIEHCIKMRTMAQQFQLLQQKGQRNTQFIQIYLLKDAYVMMNRLTYTVLHKQNHIQLPADQFSQLIKQQNKQYYQILYDATIKQCTFITGLFNQKYKLFAEYINKFSADDIQLIKQVVNQQPYQSVNTQVFEKELRKWEYVFIQDQESKENQYVQWRTLKDECKKMLDMRIHG